MKTFPYVEDYLEKLSGNDYSFILHFVTRVNMPEVKIQLARYDVSIVRNMADNTAWGVALTDRQAELALKLVLKYRKQFAKFDIDVSHLETNPQFRLPIRKINRERSLGLVDGRMELKYPYDGKMVEQIREFSKHSQGKTEWLHELKTWRIALSEYNINYIVTWAQNNHFTIDDDILSLYSQVIAAEKTPYEIKLTQVDGTYKIQNAADSLQSYVDTHIGKNLIKLVDYAGVLGYTVDNTLLQLASEQYGSQLAELGPLQKIHLIPSDDNFATIMSYAEITSRYPVCIYDPPGVGHKLDLQKFASEDQILRFDHNGKNISRDVSLNDAKIVHAVKIPNDIDFNMPLLITTVDMMYGGRRLNWINRAEKIVYFVNAKLNNNEDTWQLPD